MMSGDVRTQARAQVKNATAHIPKYHKQEVKRKSGNELIFAR